ncbi:MAG TPA: hypothetical protein LFW14_02775 [Rickettsia endosymbiont of Degeeriella rufa]|nr:hypothetical protein [Rickettsia endosymbiont of Degeeriella rufa]
MAKFISETLNQISKKPNIKFVSLADILKYEQPTKYLAKTTEYLKAGTTPILTANQSFILGYTNSEERIFNQYPAIIFDILLLI